MANYAVKRWCFAMVVLLTVGCIALMMQGMLPLNDNTLLGFRRRHNDQDEASAKSRVPHGYKMSSATTTVNIKEANLYAEALPANLQQLAKAVQVTNSKVKVMDRDMFYREALPPEGVTPTHQNALLLHGMNFKSETWLNLGTIRLLAAMGHRVVAFDLPGYGETAGDQFDVSKRGEFLNEAIHALQLDSAVVISPSMSGSFSLPYLFQFPGKMGGYAPVAPIFTDKYTKQQYETVQTPTVIIYGELDEQLGDISTNNLKNIPNSQEQKLPKARHPAYLDQPQMFHQLLYNFFLKLKRN